MARALVILTTSTYRATDFVDAARALGVELAIASDAEPPLGTHDRFVLIDCHDIHEAAARIADLAARTPIDSIIAADDRGVAIAAAASELIGLPHNPPGAAAATLDKLSLRRLLAGRELAQPAFRPVGPSDSPAALGAELGYPLVVKPTSLSAGQGVIRADGPAELARAVDRARRIQVRAGMPADAPLVVERFVAGPEVAVDGLVWDDGLEVLAVFDKPEPLDGPYFEETIFTTPSRHPVDTLEEIEAATARAVSALGLTHGPVHAELRLGPDGPVVIEIAARTIGGLCGRALRFGLMETPLEVLVLRQALGMRKRGFHREPEASGVLMVPIPRSGTLRSVSGEEDARSIPGVTDIEWTMSPGSQVEAMPDGGRYLGFVFARAAEPAAVETALRAAQAALTVYIA